MARQPFDSDLRDSSGQALDEASELIDQVLDALERCEPVAGPAPAASPSAPAASSSAPAASPELAASRPATPLGGGTAPAAGRSLARTILGIGPAEAAELARLSRLSPAAPSPGLALDEHGSRDSADEEPTLTAAALCGPSLLQADDGSELDDEKTRPAAQSLPDVPDDSVADGHFFGEVDRSHQQDPANIDAWPEMAAEAVARVGSDGDGRGEEHEAAAVRSCQSVAPDERGEDEEPSLRGGRSSPLAVAEANLAGLRAGSAAKMDPLSPSAASNGPGRGRPRSGDDENQVVGQPPPGPLLAPAAGALAGQTLPPSVASRPRSGAAIALVLLWLLAIGTSAVAVFLYVRAYLL